MFALPLSARSVESLNLYNNWCTCHSHTAFTARGASEPYACIYTHSRRDYKLPQQRGVARRRDHLNNKDEPAAAAASPNIYTQNIACIHTYLSPTNRLINTGTLKAHAASQPAARHLYFNVIISIIMKSRATLVHKMGVSWLC